MNNMASGDTGQNLSLPIIGAVAVHLVVFTLLIGSWSFSYSKPKTFEIPKSIKAELVVLEKPKPVQEKPVVTQPKPQPKPETVSKPKPKAETKPVVQPKTEAKPVLPKPVEPKPNTVNVSKPAETKPAVVETPKQTETKPETAPAEDLFENLLAEMAAEDSAIQEQIEAIEQSQIRQAEIAAQVSDYIVVITQQVEEKWSRPVELRLMDLSNIEAVVAVEILPTGELQSATVVQPSGNENYDQSVLRAIEKVRRFTVPQDSEVFEAGGFRKLNITFRPEDLMKP
ncbi:cell envelope integrity protein TolA [Reinekea sp. G2M2-21]|uniref:cell envelope integrity protein TolA n=1 Tax=Reinekea sp. G2M2-21 TaxID=2788942 RepID=UPI0018AB846C|nr:cell envelope integrity protein TolA [Reinekea sp. G2M2-21]